MWSDNKTNRDFLNVRCVVDTAAEMIVQAGTRDTLDRMNTIQRINHALAQIVASLNVAAAVVVVLTSAAAGLRLGGIFGLIAGVVLGTVLAGVLCGLLALLINIRDLLAQSLTPRG